jgi:N-acetyl-D-muramate 6-phosphate phosphatase
MRAVLFDLDGTLLDTAPDMVPVLNRLRAEENLPALPFAAVRPYVSNGSAGLVRVGFPDTEPTRQAELQQRYLRLYQQALLGATTMFPGVDTLLDQLEAGGIPWGVVTNKPAYLTEPLLAGLGLHTRAACVVSGDTLPKRKPDPAPVSHALAAIGAVPHRSIYVGDARRDIDAGRGAGARTIAVTYGYIPPGDDPGSWGAEAVVVSPAELTTTVSALLGRFSPTQ